MTKMFFFPAFFAVRRRGASVGPAIVLGCVVRFCVHVAAAFVADLLAAGPVSHNRQRCLSVAGCGSLRCRQWPVGFASCGSSPAAGVACRIERIGQDGRHVFPGQPVLGLLDHTRFFVFDRRSDRPAESRSGADCRADMDAGSGRGRDGPDTDSTLAAGRRQNAIRK